MQSKQEQQEKFKAALKHLHKSVKEQGLRNTPQRFVVLSAIFEMEGSFLPEDICKKVKRKKVARCSVYNALDFFVKNEILIEHPRTFTIN